MLNLYYMLMKLTHALLALVLTAGASYGANVATGGNIVTTTVGSGDWWQSVGQDATIGNGVTLSITNATWQTIIQQNSSATSTLTIETGGTLDFSGASGNGLNFFIGNGSTGTGILNLNGGTINGASLTNFSLGRDGATAGILNISDGSATLGASTSNVYFNGTKGKINFTANSEGSLVITGADAAYYEGLYTNGNLSYDGSSAGAFSDHFTVNGSTLTATAVPEASVSALFGLAGLSLLLRRRR